MDEQLERWAAAWQKQEIQEMQLLSRARKVHRTEASLVTASIAGWLLAVVLAVVAVAIRPLWQTWVALGSTVIGGIILARDVRGVIRTRGKLVETPLDLVSDMLLVHERELSWWTGRLSLTFGVVGSLFSLTMAAHVGSQLAARGSGALQAWSLLGLVCVSLGALTYAGIKRTRYLRRELAVLQELRSELE
jgi:hypothetical protein